MRVRNIPSLRQWITGRAGRGLMDAMKALRSIQQPVLLCYGCHSINRQPLPGSHYKGAAKKVLRGFERHIKMAYRYRRIHLIFSTLAQHGHVAANQSGNEVEEITAIDPLNRLRMIGTFPAYGIVEKAQGDIGAKHSAANPVFPAPLKPHSLFAEAALFH